MCAFVDLYQNHEGMTWKTWIWWMDVHKDTKWKEGMKGLDVEHKDREQMEYKDLEWMWKRKDEKLQVWKEELWIWKKRKVYQHLETLFVQWDTYYFQHKMRVHVYGVHEWIGQV